MGFCELFVWPFFFGVFFEGGCLFYCSEVFLKVKTITLKQKKHNRAFIRYDHSHTTP